MSTSAQRLQPYCFDPVTGLPATGQPSTSSGTVGLEAFKAALRTAAARRIRPNAAPLVAPAAFAAGTYSTGDVVASGGNWYLCVNPTDAVPSRTATAAPTGTSTAVICPDGVGSTLCCWMFMSPALTLDSLGYPITVSGPVSTLPAFAGSNRSFSGYDGTGAQNDVMYRTVSGLADGRLFGKADRVVGVYKTGGGTEVIQPANVVREYVTDSTFFALRNPYGPSGNIWVNGKPLLPGAGINTSSTNAYWGVNFGSRERRVLTWLNPSTPTNVYIDSKATLYQTLGPAPSGDFYGCEFGDSWTFGVGGMGLSYGQGMVDVFINAAGMLGYSAFSLGGTGVWNDNAVAGNDYLGRWRAGVAKGIYDSGIRVLGIQGSVNDSLSGTGGGSLGAPTSATLTARTLTLAREMRAQCPIATILFKAIPADAAAVTWADTTNAAYKAAYDAFSASDSNCLWIDASATSPSGVATINTRNTVPQASLPPTAGTESLIGGPSGAGMNSSHPSMWGNIFMGQDQVTAMYRALSLDMTALR
jgi:hypothetical protein